MVLVLRGKKAMAWLTITHQPLVNKGE